jgi:hypothetical protein
MAGVKLSADELAGATEIAPVKLSADDLAGATEIGPPEKTSFLREAGHRIAEPFKEIAAPFRNATMPTSAADVGARLKQNLPIVGRFLGQGVKELGQSVLGAAQGVGTVAAHPIETLTNPSYGREMSRGLAGNVPLLGLALDRAGALEENSPEDAAAAPGVRAATGLGTGIALARGAPEVPGLAREAVQAAKNVPGALRGAAESSLERSAARNAVAVPFAPPTPIRTALKEAGKEVGKHGMETAGLAMAGEALSHVVPVVGHAVTGLAAAGRVGIPIAKAAAIVADEGAAAFLRKLGMSGPKVLEAEKAATVVPEAAPVAAEATAAPPEAAAASAAPEAPAATEHSQIAILRKALLTADKEQAGAIQGAIDGLIDKQRRAGARGGPATEAAHSSSFAPSAEVPKEEVSPARAPASEPSKRSWTPGPTDERFARQLGMSVEDYRKTMLARNERLSKVAGTPEFLPLVDKLARAALKVADPETFVKEVAGAGLSPGHARKIWNAAHKVKAARAAAPAADEAEELGL